MLIFMRWVWLKNINNTPSIVINIDSDVIDIDMSRY